ncbi:MAG: C4-dicarboxylate ABC transporter permease [Muricomes sp.]|uniref:YfcC family protein n=1 Tax=Faecalicatena contorta TaxID=39482 RepID=UPI002E9E1DD4|nr:C4-dicarboxylate ABC transporter permease [Muricomes sp.]
MSSKDTAVKEKKKFSMPPAFALLVVMILIGVIATWILPAGEFDREMNDAGKTLVVAGSYHGVEASPVSVWEGFMAIPQGMVKSATIIFGVLLIGGSFTIIVSTGMIQSALGKVEKVFKGRELLMIPIIMAAASVMCCFIGLLELSMVIIPILIPICLILGFDSLTAIAMALVSTAAGFGAAVANPFTVVVAQPIGELPLYSGAGYRTICLIVITAIGIAYVMRHAIKVRKKPELSITYQTDIELRKEYGVGKKVEMTGRRKVAMFAFLICFAILIVGALKFSWGLIEIGTMFLITGLLVGFICKLSLTEICDKFSEGLSAFIGAALISGFASGITIVLENGKIIDTIINAVAQLVQALPPSVAAVGMLITQLLFNFIVPSGSGQALISMPIMFPLADLVGVSRQVAVLAFQFGDGLSNIVWPTLGYLWVCIAYGKIKYEQWFKFIIPLIGIWYLACMILLVIAQGIGWS